MDSMSFMLRFRRSVCCQFLIRRRSRPCFLRLPWLALRLYWLSFCSSPAFSCLALGWIEPWSSAALLLGRHRCAFPGRRSLSCLELIQGRTVAGHLTFQLGSQGASKRSWRGCVLDETCVWCFAGWMLANCSSLSWFTGRRGTMTRLTHSIW